MIGLIASIGLIVAIFVSEVAFTDKKLQADAKLGAILSAFHAFICYAVAQFFHYDTEDVQEQEKLQIEEPKPNPNPNPNPGAREASNRGGNGRNSEA